MTFNCNMLLPTDHVDPAGAPTGLHAPSQRAWLTRTDGWDVRAIAESDERYRYFARHGLLHLQLFEPRRGASILSPCPLTRDRWELCIDRAARIRCRDQAELAHTCRRIDIRLPNAATIAALLLWFVEIPLGSITTIEIRAFA